MKLWSKIFKRVWGLAGLRSALCQYVGSKILNFGIHVEHVLKNFQNFLNFVFSILVQKLRHDDPPRSALNMSMGERRETLVTPLPHAHIQRGSGRELFVTSWLRYVNLNFTMVRKQVQYHVEAYHTLDSKLLHDGSSM